MNAEWEASSRRQRQYPNWPKNPATILTPTMPDMMTFIIQRNIQHTKET